MYLIGESWGRELRNHGDDISIILPRKSLNLPKIPKSILPIATLPQKTYVPDSFFLGGGIPAAYFIDSVCLCSLQWSLKRQDSPQPCQMNLPSYQKWCLRRYRKKGCDAFIFVGIEVSDVGGRRFTMMQIDRKKRGNAMNFFFWLFNGSN